MASPRMCWPPKDSARFFRGAPAKRSRMVADHSTMTPQLAGRSGEIATPCSASIFVQTPSDPMRGHEAPPKASTMASKARISCAPSAFSIVSAPDDTPFSVQRVRTCTSRSPKRRKKARSSGEALKLLGKTRPLEPTKVFSPSSPDHARKASGDSASIAGASFSAAAP